MNEIRKWALDEIQSENGYDYRNPNHRFLCIDKLNLRDGKINEDNYKRMAAIPAGGVICLRKSCSHISL
ncbi:MAG TPA: hypothetical protein VN258_10410 [Mobilitalea sp.]|nr:hypothetical protein [Mobilitalea sp.]